jgi:hypothetical protein
LIFQVHARRHHSGWLAIAWYSLRKCLLQCRPWLASLITRSSRSGFYCYGHIGRLYTCLSYLLVALYTRLPIAREFATGLS